MAFKFNIGDRVTGKETGPRLSDTAPALSFSEAPENPNTACNSTTIAPSGFSLLGVTTWALRPIHRGRPLPFAI